MHVRTKDGVVTTTAAARILDGPEAGVYIIRLVTFYNPTGAAVTFVLRRISLDEDRQEITTRRWDDSIPATDSWVFGKLGGRIVLSPGQRLELVLDSSPANPVEYGLDYSWEIEP